MKYWRASIACILIMSISVRLVPGASIGLPYGFDVYDVVSRIRSAMSTGKFETSMPQGPMLYSLLCELVILGGISPEATMSIVAPALLSLIVIPAILYARKSVKDEFAAIIGGILASSTNLIVHQTGGTVVPEALGILFAGFFLSLFVQKNWKDRKIAVLLSFAALGTLASHHLTTLNVLFGIGIVILFKIISDGKRGSVRSEVRKMMPIFIPLGLAALLIWKFVAPQHTLEVVNLTLAGASGLTLAVGGFFAAFVVSMACRMIYRRRASFYLAEKPFIFAIITFCASLAILLIFHLVGGMGMDMLRMILYVGVPISVVYVPLSVTGLVYTVNSRIDDHSLACLMAFPTACLSLAMFLVLQPGFGTLAYREVSFMLYSILPVTGIGLAEIIRKASPAKRYVAAFVLAYSVLALASTSYPSRSYLIGLSESYAPSDLRISEIVVNITCQGEKIDTDVRMGNLLLYYSGRDINWVSNVSYWTSPGPPGAWLGKSAMAGHPVPIPSNVEYILVSEEMLESNGGVVVDQPSRRFYPLPDAALRYLEEKPGISKVADSGTAFFFYVSRH